MITLFSTVKRLLTVRATLLILFTALTASTAFATSYISDVMLIGGSKTTVDNLKSTYGNQGWIVIGKDLNDNCGPSSDYIYLLYKADNSNGINCGYITDFYISNASRPVSETVDFGGRTYHLVPYDGDSHFKSMQGDLNSNAGGADIHLYYTKDLKDNKAVTSISFNDNKSGGVGVNGATNEGYDLNKGCGSSSDYIYMHISTAAATIPSLSGSGTSSSPFIINNANDWIAFAANVNNGLNTDKYYKVSDSYSDQTQINKMVGNTAHPFKGTLDGNGKTVCFNIYSSVQGAAPFNAIDAATIKNLDVWGLVDGFGYHTAGLVGLCYSSGPITIKDCKVRVSVKAPNYAGGIVGHGGHGTLTIENCTFESIVSNFQNFGGGIVGWCDALNLTVKNCFFNGYLYSGGGKQHPIVLRDGSSAATANVTDTYYLDEAFPSIGLGNNLVSGSSATPVSRTYRSGDWADEVTIQGKTYYKLSTPKYLTYEYGFELGMSDWTLQNVDNGTILATGDRHSGQYCLAFAQCNHDQYLISPQLFATSKDSLNFYIKGPSSGTYKFQIGLSTTTNDLSAFTWSNNYEWSDPDWYLVQGKLPVSVKYFAIKYVSGSASFRVDDFKFIEPCPAPRNLTHGNITSNSATFNWECPSEDVLGYFWKIRRSDTEDVWIDSNSINDRNETSATITGLQPSTKYMLYLQALYPGANTSAWMVAEFTTGVAMAQLPYSYGFEDGMSLWEASNTAGNTGVTTKFAQEGSHSFFFEKSDNSYQILMSPLFEENKTIKGSFYCRAESYSSPTTVYIGTTGYGGGSVEWIEGYVIRATDWTKIDFVMPQGARHFCVVWMNSGSNNNNLYVDNFNFTEALSLTFPKEGYRTYYDSNHTLILPKGMKARIVIGIDADGVPIYHTVADGYAGTDESALAEENVYDNYVISMMPVVLQVAPSDSEQTFLIDYDAPMGAPLDYDNYLGGSDEATTTSRGDFFYRLGYNDDDNYGWVFGAENGGPFQTQPHEAWLYLWSRLAQGRDYFGLFNYDKATGVGKVKDIQDVQGTIFNLSGQRLQKEQKGINIINGKKIMIK